VEASAASRLPAIQALPSWEEKQDAVDELFEDIEFQLKASNPVLGMHPRFGEWVEKALEDYLQAIQQAGQADTSTIEENKDESQDGIPVFMDCYSENDGPDQLVPSILHPLTTNPRGTNGNMVEEWELAAHKKSKRIMIRRSTQKIANALTEHTAASILVSGCQGVGKTAAVAAIVASARSSGYLVLYLPNGDQLHQNGFYIEPNPQKKGMFDLPIMSQRACDDFLKTHKNDMNGMNVPKSVIAEHLAKDQLQRLFRDAKDDSQIALSALLDFGRERINFAAPCLSAATDYLMYHQDEKPFLLAMDEFNCFYMPSHYFHADYDPEVKKAIPYDCISLFQPAMEAMALTGSSPPRIVKRGAVLAAVTESHAVTRATTDALVNRAKELSAEEGTPFVHVEVPRLSKVEVEHMLSNYEATGVGKLRLDRGETVSNAQEVEYLRMVSGGIAGHLMNACMVE
jgi:small subunit ribosomal protein S29